jgi:type III secretion system FlhB-like substrate exporter
MESNGLPGKIHVSLDTANHLIDCGKGHWASPRDTLVEAKGKGTIQTYWAEPIASGSNAEGTSVSNSDEDNSDQTALVNWTADILVSLTKRAIALHSGKHIHEQVIGAGPGKLASTVIDEFKDVIDMPQFSSGQSSNLLSPAELSESIKKEIQGFVVAISLVYRGECMH